VILMTLRLFYYFLSTAARSAKLKQRCDSRLNWLIEWSGWDREVIFGVGCKSVIFGSVDLPSLSRSGRADERGINVINVIIGDDCRMGGWDCSCRVRFGLKCVTCFTLSTGTLLEMFLQR
jgi:hypothetical protein